MEGRLRILTLATAMLCVASVAHAWGSKAKPVTGEKYHWYEDGEKRTIVLDPALLAEFQQGSAGAKSLQLAVPMEKSGPVSGGVQLWRAGESSGGEAKTLSAQAARETGGSFSPVFHPEGGGALRALAGGVIVTFSPDWTRAQCEAWIAARKLNIKRTFDFANIYVIESPAGMVSLDLANELQETGEVLSASPNWWTQVETK